jgi:hypothetical protein
MDVLRRTIIQDGYAEVQVVEPTYASEITNVSRALLALSYGRWTTFGQMAWLDEKIQSLEFLADVVGLEVSPSVIEERNQLIRKVR